MSPEIITKLTEAIVSVVIILITVYVVPLLKTKLGDTKYDILTTFAFTVVRSAEKIYTKEEWKEKKDYAVRMLIAKAEELGIILTYGEINAIIEGTVQAVKG